MLSVGYQVIHTFMTNFVVSSIRKASSSNFDQTESQSQQQK